MRVRWYTFARWHVCSSTVYSRVFCLFVFVCLFVVFFVFSFYVLFILRILCYVSRLDFGCARAHTLFSSRLTQHLRLQKVDHSLGKLRRRTPDLHAQMVGGLLRNHKVAEDEPRLVAGRSDELPSDRLHLGDVAHLLDAGSQLLQVDVGDGQGERVAHLVRVRRPHLLEVADLLLRDGRQLLRQGRVVHLRRLCRLRAGFLTGAVHGAGGRVDGHVLPCSLLRFPPLLLSLPLLLLLLRRSRVGKQHVGQLLLLRLLLLLLLQHLDGRRGRHGRRGAVLLVGLHLLLLRQRRVVLLLGRQHVRLPTHVLHVQRQLRLRLRLCVRGRRRRRLRVRVLSRLELRSGLDCRKAFLLLAVHLQTCFSCFLHDGVQDRQTRVHQQVFAAPVKRQNLRHERRVVRKLEELVAPLLQRQAGGVLEGADKLEDGSRHGGQLGSELHESRDKVTARVGLLVRLLQEVAHPVDDLVVLVLLRHEAVLAQHPCDDLDERLGQVVAGIEQLVVQLHRVEAELLVVVLLQLVRALGDHLQHALHRLVLHVLLTELDDRVHCADVPVHRRQERVGQRGDVVHEVRLKVLVVRCRQELQQTRHDDHHVVLVRHRVQQVECLALDRLVVVLEAVHHNLLVPGGVAGLNQHNAAEGRDAEVLQVRVRRLQEDGDRLGGGSHELFVVLETGDGLHALEDNGVADVGNGAGALHHLGQLGGSFLGLDGVSVAQHREQLQQLDLDPRRGDTVARVLVLLAEAVLADLLQDVDEGHHQMLVFVGFEDA
eukprot:Rhum_TRINITY_DN14689_c16_g1::Rhum_TRINITY_DN14689_c16_g1_i1::g.109881::m.109881